MVEEDPGLQTITFRDGRSGSTSVVLLMGVFGGIVAYSFARIHVLDGVLEFLAVIAISWFLVEPRVTVAVAPDGVTIWEVWPWRERESCHAAAALSVPDIAEVDSDSGTYYHCCLRLPSGRRVIVFSEKSRERVAEVRDRLRTALALSTRQAQG